MRPQAPRSGSDGLCSVVCRYARLQDWDEFHAFSSRAKHLVARRTPTSLYYEGVVRYLEGQVLYLQKQIAEQLETAQDHGVELLKVRPGAPSPTAWRPTCWASPFLTAEFTAVIHDRLF